MVGRGIRWTGAILAIVTSVSIVVMMVVGAADVLGVALFRMPVPATFEITELMMVCAVFGGMAYAQAQQKHIRVLFLVRHFSRRVRGVLELVAVLVGVVFFSLLTWRCAVYFWQSWSDGETGTSLVKFPLYPSKLIMLIGAALMTLQLLVDLIPVLQAVFRRDEPEVGP